VLSDERGAGEPGASSIQQTVQAIEFVEFAQVFRIACSFSFDSPRR